MKVLVIAAHPDDEILGCGGTIANHVKKKHKVNVCILGEGITSRSKKRDININKKQLENLHNVSKKANKLLGVKNIKLLKLPDNRFDSLNLLDVIKYIENEINLFKPNIIYTHSAFDLNIDHKITADAVVTACRPQFKKFLKKIICFEIPSSSEWENNQKNHFKPNFYEEISGTINKKLKALKIYKQEMRRWPHPRSIKGVGILAKYRGSQVGVNAAEAFYIIREINFE